MGTICYYYEMSHHSTIDTLNQSLPPLSILSILGGSCDFCFALPKVLNPGDTLKCHEDSLVSSLSCHRRLPFESPLPPPLDLTLMNRCTLWFHKIFNIPLGFHYCLLVQQLLVVQMVWQSRYTVLLLFRTTERPLITILGGVKVLDNPLVASGWKW